MDSIFAADALEPPVANAPLLLYSPTSRTGDSRAASRRERPGSNGHAPMRFTRITVDAKQMGGVPCIRGLRIPVATVIGMAADGMTATDILAAYPDLERDDIREALHYAADAVREREFPLTVP